MKQIVVIGAGYGGLRAIEHLVSLENVAITLIDKNPFHYLQTEAYGYIAGRFDLHDVAVDLKNWSYGHQQHVNFIHSEAQSIDVINKTVTLSAQTIRYDYLIMALGAETNFFSFISGLRENSFGVKKLFRAFKFRKAFEDLLYSKLENCDQLQEGNINIAIGGAGLSGVEIAAEMAYVIKKYTKSIGESTKEIHIHLIDAAPTILPGMSRYIIDKTHQRLEKLGIHIMTNAFIDNVDKNIITLKDGRTLPYYFMIFTGGIKVPEIAINCDVERNRINQFITNAFLQLPQAPDVYAIGDCVELHDRNGAILPPTAQTAERSAEHVAESIKNILNLGQPQPFHGRVDGVFVALGGHYAVGELFGIIKVSGSLAYLLKKLITYIYYIGLKFKVNTGFKKRTVSRP